MCRPRKFKMLSVIRAASEQPNLTQRASANCGFGRRNRQPVLAILLQCRQISVPSRRSLISRFGSSPRWLPFRSQSLSRSECGSALVVRTTPDQPIWVRKHWRSCPERSSLSVRLPSSRRGITKLVLPPRLPMNSPRQLLWQRTSAALAIRAEN